MKKTLAIAIMISGTVFITSLAFAGNGVLNLPNLPTNQSWSKAKPTAILNTSVLVKPQVQQQGFDVGKALGDIKAGLVSCAPAAISAVKTGVTISAIVNPADLASKAITAVAIGTGTNPIDTLSRMVTINPGAQNAPFDGAVSRSVMTITTTAVNPSGSHLGGADYTNLKVDAIPASAAPATTSTASAAPAAPAASQGFALNNKLGVPKGTLVSQQWEMKPANGHTEEEVVAFGNMVNAHFEGAYGHWDNDAAQVQKAKYMQQKGYVAIIDHRPDNFQRVAAPIVTVNPVSGSGTVPKTEQTQFTVVSSQPTPQKDYNMNRTPVNFMSVNKTPVTINAGQVNVSPSFVAAANMAGVPDLVKAMNQRKY